MWVVGWSMDVSAASYEIYILSSFAAEFIFYVCVFGIELMLRFLSVLDSASLVKKFLLFVLELFSF